MKLVGNSRRDKISQIGIEVGGKSTFVDSSEEINKFNFLERSLRIDIKHLLDHQSIEDSVFGTTERGVWVPLIVCFLGVLFARMHNYICYIDIVSRTVNDGRWVPPRKVAQVIIPPPQTLGEGSLGFDRIHIYKVAM